MEDKNMAVSVCYDKDQKMVITGVDCHCGSVHMPIDKDIYIGKGLIDREEFTKDPMGAYENKIYCKAAPMKTAVIWNREYIDITR